MDTLKIGKIINSPQNRDAVHMAIVPMEAAMPFGPATHIRLDRNGKATIHGSEPCIGIVDPFLREKVQKGDKFWLFLYPGSITSLRHAWTHPAFGEVEGTQEFTRKQLSVAWMETFCEKEGLSYSYLLEHDSVGDREDLCSGLSDNEEFSKHFKIITGRECPEYFSCAC